VRDSELVFSVVACSDEGLLYHSIHRVNDGVRTAAVCSVCWSLGVVAVRTN